VGRRSLRVRHADFDTGVLADYPCAFMRVSLFDRVSYDDLADRRTLVSGGVAAGACERLAGLVGKSGQLELQVAVEKDARGVRLAGKVGGQITLSCRRCLGPVDWRVEREVDVVVVGSEAAMRSLPEDVDAHHAEGMHGRLLDVLEEEVLLALPDHGEHPPGACEAPGASQGDVSTGETAGTEDEKVHRPFAALAALKRSEPEPDSE
jgi:uncharacterized protein